MQTYHILCVYIIYIHNQNIYQLQFGSLMFNFCHLGVLFTFEISGSHTGVDFHSSSGRDFFDAGHSWTPTSGACSRTAVATIEAQLLDIFCRKKDFSVENGWLFGIFWDFWGENSAQNKKCHELQLEKIQRIKLETLQNLAKLAHWPASLEYLAAIFVGHPTSNL